MNEIKGLILKVLREEELSGPERRELDRWLAESPDNQLVLDQVSDPAWVAEVLAKMDRMKEDEVWDRVQAAAAQHPSRPATTFGDFHSYRRRVIFRWTAAAAAVLLLLTGGYFLVLNKNKPAITQTAAAPLTHDIPAPTGTRTTLTLAGGQTIFLDSVQNGTLSEQGSARVSKLATNQLAYNTSSTTSSEKPVEAVYNTLSTAKGGQTMVVLADGTQVWLDAASSLTYPTTFAGGTRNVALTGQAYFEVAHRSNQPFSVEVNGTEVKDIGTAFNINAYEDEPVAKITLVEGVVAVMHQDRQVVLKPGQQARIDGARLSVAAGVDVDEVLAWKNGQFQFDNAGTAEIMRQVARWYDVDVRYEGDVLQRHFSGGVPRAANASALLHVLELTKSVRFRVEGKQIIVQPYQ